jgi:hypothetical protein
MSAAYYVIGGVIMLGVGLFAIMFRDMLRYMKMRAM